MQVKAQRDSKQKKNSDFVFRGLLNTHQVNSRNSSFLEDDC